MRFCVAVSAALRRMTLQNTITTRNINTSRSASSSSKHHKLSNLDPTEREGTYDSMVEYFVESFLQGVLRAALQSRGEPLLYLV